MTESIPRRTSTLVPFACLQICVCFASELLAFQENLPAKPEQTQAKESLAEQKPAAALVQKTPAEKTQDELERTVQSMRSVSKKLGQKDVSEETRRQQKSIIDNIDALLETLKQAPSQDLAHGESQDRQKNQSKSQDRQSADHKDQPQRQPNESQQQPPQASARSWLSS